MSAPMQRVRPDGGLNHEYGTWGYDGPRWFFRDPATGDHHYFDDAAVPVVVAALASSYGAALVDLWDVESTP